MVKKKKIRKMFYPRNSERSERHPQNLFISWPIEPCVGNILLTFSFQQYFESIGTQMCGCKDNGKKKTSSFQQVIMTCVLNSYVYTLRRLFLRIIFIMWFFFLCIYEKYSISTPLSFRWPIRSGGRQKKNLFLFVFARWRARGEILTDACTDDYTRTRLIKILREKESYVRNKLSANALPRLVHNIHRSTPKHTPVRIYE